MKALTLWLAVLVGTAGCASTRYEEYGPPIEEPLELPPPPPADDATEPATTGGTPESRLPRLEAMLAERLDRLEAADREQATRMAALSEQVESLRAQVAALKRPGSESTIQTPASAPSRSVTDLYDDGLTHFDAQRYGPAREAFRAVPTTPVAIWPIMRSIGWVSVTTLKRITRPLSWLFAACSILPRPRRMTMPRSSSVTVTTA